MSRQLCQEQQDARAAAMARIGTRLKGKFGKNTTSSHGP